MELEMLTERLSDLKRQNLCLTNDDELDMPESSRKLPLKEMKCFKCKLFVISLLIALARKENLATDGNIFTTVVLLKWIVILSSQRKLNLLHPLRRD